MESSITAWRGTKPNIRPLASGKRLRDLRPGDKVIVLGKPAELSTVEVYR